MNYVIISLTLLVLLLTAINVQAANNDSMDVDDIMNVKPAVPFGNDFLKMLIGIAKWIAFAGFIASVFITLGSGSVATAMDNANMSERSQSNLFKLAKLIIIGVLVYLAGVHIFKTYL